VTRIDPGVVSLVAELRGHERQIAEELAGGRRGSPRRSCCSAPPVPLSLQLVKC
jgi:hypothetical protein